MGRAAVLPLLLLLAACASPEQVAAERAARAAADDQECRELGFRPGTEAYGDCRLRLREIRAQQEHARALRLYDPYWHGGPWGPWPHWW